jgi:hypothetical protein
VREYPPSGSDSSPPTARELYKLAEENRCFPLTEEDKRILADFKGEVFSLTVLSRYVVICCSGGDRKMLSWEFKDQLSAAAFAEAGHRVLNS